jgi:hypothetical protein
LEEEAAKKLLEEEAAKKASEAEALLKINGGTNGTGDVATD